MQYNSTNIFKRVWENFYISYIPNKNDNLKQILIKVLFAVCLVTLVVSSVYLADYFWEAEYQQDIINQSREVWHETFSENDKENSKNEQKANKIDPAVINYMLEENPDFKGWLTIAGTKVDNPIYQTTNNEFYLNHNQLKKKSVYGALYFDYRNKITEKESDKNLVIYGHEMKNGTMFGELKKYKSIDFYKQYPTIEFATLYEKQTYKIYSVFILNATKDDDNGYIYNVYRNNFNTEADFDYWVKEAYDRSVINTGVDVDSEDEIVTLITCSNDFSNARLVVMARKLRKNESAIVDTSNCTVNANPRHPQKWYDHRGMKNPFKKNEN